MNPNLENLVCVGASCLISDLLFLTLLTLSFTYLFNFFYFLVSFIYLLVTIISHNEYNFILGGIIS